MEITKITSLEEMRSIEWPKVCRINVEGRERIVLGVGQPTGAYTFIDPDEEIGSPLGSLISGGTCYMEFVEGAVHIKRPSTLNANANHWREDYSQKILNKMDSIRKARRELTA
jgi:hypothetical protein